MIEWEPFTEHCWQCGTVYQPNLFVADVLLQTTCPQCGARNPRQIYRTGNIAIPAVQRGSSLRLELAVRAREDEEA